MRRSLLSVLLLLAGCLSLSLPAFGQETGLSGVITDAQGGLIPSAKVEVKETGGASYAATTDAHGVFVVPNLTGAEYTVTATAPGFATVQKKLQLLIGQVGQVDFSLPVASTSQGVIVEASDQLAIDTTSSVVAGNVTPQEMQDVPIDGRNYMELAALVPGIKANQIGDVPVTGGDAEVGKFQTTMDGQQVSQDSIGSSFGQPHFSEDAMSQFQIITNRFDATAGRSAGIYINTQSKSGTDLLHGGAFGYFRNSFFNAADPKTKTVLPFQDEQFGGTLGGPIRKDKLWYFGSYEGEHQPGTYSTTLALPSLYGATIFTHPTLYSVELYLGRVDYQLNEKNHIFVRGDGFTSSTNYIGASDPSSASSSAEDSYGYQSGWSRNISDKMVNDVHAGFHYFKTTFLPMTNTPVFAIPNASSTGGTATVGAAYNRPETFTQPAQQYRDDLLWLKGKHSLKLGGEFLYFSMGGYFEQYGRGGITSCIPSPSSSVPNVASFFPNGTSDVTTWNWSAIKSFCSSTLNYLQGFGNFSISIPRKIIGVWAQDDWKILPRLTLNLGVRYDDDIGALLNNLVVTNGLLTPNTNPNLNFAPRLGFAYDLRGDGKTSIRGGAGLYYADMQENETIDDELFNGQTTVQATVSGPGSTINLPNPFSGQNPLTNPGATLVTPQYIARGAKTPYSLEASFGIARKLPWKTTLTADMTHMRVYGDWILLDGNLLVNPANPQQNLNPNTVLSPTTQIICASYAVKPTVITNYATAAPGGVAAKQVCNQSFASTGNRQFTQTNGAGDIADALEVGIKHATTKGLTAAIAYTWSRTKNSTGGAFSYPNKPFVAGIQQEWANGTDDQRHTLTANAQYNWKYGLMVSVLDHFGSGLAYATSSGNSSGVNGYTSGTRTFAAGVTPVPLGFSGPCPTTTCTTIYAPMKKVYYDAGYGYWIIQRDGFRGPEYNRTDARLQETFKIKERYHAIVAVEAFNVLNHTNYSGFGTSATSATYGTATAGGNAGVAEYSARQLQFVGRFSF